MKQRLSLYLGWTSEWELVFWKYLDCEEITGENSHCPLLSMELFFWLNFTALTWLWSHDGPGTPGVSCIIGYHKQCTAMTKVAEVWCLLSENIKMKSGALIWGTCFTKKNCVCGVCVAINKFAFAWLFVVQSSENCSSLLPESQDYILEWPSLIVPWITECLILVLCFSCLPH